MIPAGVQVLIARSIARRGVDSLSFLYKGRRGWSALTRSRATERGRSRFYKDIWEEAAASLGASLSVLSGSLLEIRRDDVRIRVFENYTSLDDPVTLRVAGNKPLVHALLGEQAIPIPAHGVFAFDDVAGAWSSLSPTGAPLVVKPARGTGAGEGVTAGIADRRGLARAMALAGAFCSEVVVERQVEGDNYRLLYFEGELLDAVHRHPPVLRGDGTSNLRQLILAENRDRARGGFATAQSLIALDWELKQTLRAQGYGMRSVPTVGEAVRLKTVVSDNRRADNIPAAETLCRSVVASGAKAAETVGARLAGVDVITPDPSVPLEECGGAVIEVNTTPGLHFHYPTRDGDRPAAVLILERLMARSF